MGREEERVVVIPEYIKSASRITSGLSLTLARTLPPSTIRIALLASSKLHVADLLTVTKSGRATDFPRMECERKVNVLIGLMKGRHDAKAKLVDPEGRSIDVCALT